MSRRNISLSAIVAAIASATVALATAGLIVSGVSASAASGSSGEMVLQGSGADVTATWSIVPETVSVLVDYNNPTTPTQTSVILWPGACYEGAPAYWSPNDATTVNPVPIQLTGVAAGTYSMQITIFRSTATAEPVSGCASIEVPAKPTPSPTTTSTTATPTETVTPTPTETTTVPTPTETTTPSPTTTTTTSTPSPTTTTTTTTPSPTTTTTTAPPTPSPTSTRPTNPRHPDTDGDGVADKQDLCAASPSGQPVNSHGCTAAQWNADTDGDGVIDVKDDCPRTVKGQHVNGHGCVVGPRWRR